MCNNIRKLRQKHGRERADKISQRLGELHAAKSLEELSKVPGLSCHPLTGDRAGQIAITVLGGWRIIFVPADDPTPRKPDGSLDWADVRAIEIVEIVDYHG